MSVVAQNRQKEKQEQQKQEEQQPAKNLFTGNLPEQGIAKTPLLDAMQAAAAEDTDFKAGKVWSLVYHKDDEHYGTIKEAHNMFFSTNYLNPMAFKSLKQFETDVVRMSANMLHGDENVVGTMTSGGTESILMAIKTYRDYARKKRPWVRRPNMIVPETVHVAFEKAAKYFDVKIIRAPIGKDFRADLAATRKLINRNTILLVGSAPSYPQGVIDPIAELGKLAQEKKLPLHVDACLGGFMLPFVKELGYPVPDFDFAVPGVTSISADVHKYGYAAKGASVILYRSMDYLRHQFLIVSNWSGGVYASPALLGTRAGSAIAAAWASMQTIGKQGFLEMADKSMQLARDMMDGVNAIDGLQVLGEPDMCVFSYHSTDPEVNIFAVGDQMEARGWSINRQQHPDALHAMVTVNHEQAIPRYLADLKASVAEVKRNPDLAYEGSAAMYGMVSKVPLKGMIEKNVLAMMEQSYAPGAASLSVAVDEGEQDLAMKLGTRFVKLVDWFRNRGR
ncbi:pyridoxal phosphate-dependent decarboxylase family protein [Biformimicrobium ophioploci]|uniref:Aspartate aminotransferase family protein n=1 Tax=Biformimicrobium ophioploci TaxID=3036711 RepID=A0ABQ6LWQ5_9GAMM|nr:aspartate aminotransferase family protein [Microbulbifer sp. NKW57]GMG86498.1 aspartate aminotransferase family protein [Microbulbifer sp. NKW57]